MKTARHRDITAYYETDPARNRFSAIMERHAELRRESLKRNAESRSLKRAARTPVVPHIELVCGLCRAPFLAASQSARYCLECRAENARRAQLRAQKRRPLMKRAQALVHLRVKDGRLPSPATLRCVDCDEPAAAYDHRDYTKPLAVQPVCDCCNNLRGPGYPYNT